MIFEKIRETIISWAEAIPIPFSSDKEERDPVTQYLILTLIITAIISLAAYLLFNRTHVFSEYETSVSVGINDTEGMQYQKLGKHIIKYSHDGVFCVNTSDEVVWSAAYSMQAPLSDIAGKSMVIAEERGTLVYVVNEKGLLGSFETRLPIIKARISENGVVALLLEDADVEWINLYDASGAQIAAVKTTMASSGYPLDFALSANAKRLAVSLASMENGDIAGKITVYDFSSAQAADESHLLGSLTYEKELFPRIYFTGSSQVAAVSNVGYKVCSIGRKVTERTSVDFDEEIVSVFYDEDHIGFVFHSLETDRRYRMEIYNYSGKRSMQTEFDFDYANVSMAGGEILMYDGSHLYSFRTSGKQKLSVTYEGTVRYFGKLSGTRKYLVISGKSIDRIKVE